MTHFYVVILGMIANELGNIYKQLLTPFNNKKKKKSLAAACLKYTEFRYQVALFYFYFVNYLLEGN